VTAIHRTTPFLIGAAVLARLTLCAQQPIFRTGVELVTVDVTVVDDVGNPVENLSAESFDVRVDGQTRRVVSADYVRYRTDPNVVPRSGAAFSSNESIDAGRLILIAVDRAHIRRVEGLAALRAAANFVDALDPADRVAAAPLDHAGPIQFTSAHSSVKGYLERLSGEASAHPTEFNIGLSEALEISDGGRSRLDQVVLRECGVSLTTTENPRRLAENEGMRDPCPTQVEQESRAVAQESRTESRLSFEAMASLIARLSSIEGPKTLVLVSEGLVAEPRLFDLAPLGAAAQAARVTIYVLQLDAPLVEAADTKVSPSAQLDRQLRADGLARVAGSARGALFQLVGADPYPFRRILRELSAYYLVAFEATSADRDGRTHRIDVSTRRRGVTLRARPAFAISGAPTTSMTPDVQLVRLLRTARLATELPLRVATYAFKDPAGTGLRVVLGAETDLAASAGATIGFVLTDTNGVIVTSGAALSEGGRFTLPATISPGEYVLKAGAVNGAGRQGSVEHRFEARLRSAGSVHVSDLMLAEQSGRQAEPLRPAVLRPASTRLEAYFEIYAPEDWKPAAGAVVFDVIPAGETGAILTKPASIARGGNGRWIVRAELPLGNLARGSYTVAARIGSTGVQLERPFLR
jgi:VWFA-related protein